MRLRKPPQRRQSGWPSALPTASQIAVSTPPQATRPSRRSRKMSNVAGRASCQQRSVWKASSPSSVAHDREQLGQRRVLVAGIGLADDALAGVHPRDHRGAVRHAVVAAREHPDERHADRDDLDALDRKVAEAGVGRGCRGLIEAHERMASSRLDSFPVMSGGILSRGRVTAQTARHQLARPWTRKETAGADAASTGATADRRPTALACRRRCSSG